MIYKTLCGKTTWIDVEQPTRADIIALTENHDVSTEIAQLLLNETRRSYFRVMKDSMYLVLHFPTIQDKTKAQLNSEQEIDFILQKDKLITVRYSGVSALNVFKKQIEMKEIIESNTKKKLSSKTLKHSPLELFYKILEFQYEKSSLFAEEIGDSIDRIENRMFEGDEGKMVSVISLVNRRVLEHTRSLSFHHNILEDVLQFLQKYKTDKDAKCIRRTVRHHKELMTILESHKEMLRDLRDTNDILVNTKTNNTMKVLTLITFGMVPLTIGVEIIRDDLSKFLDPATTVPTVVILTALTTILFFAWMKYKKWL